VAGVIAPLAVIGGVYGGYRALSASTCTGEVRLAVSAAPEIAQAVQGAASRWLATQRRVGEACIAVDVFAAAPFDVAAAVAANHGLRVAGIGQADGKTQVPHVWIPDSSIWLQRMRAAREDVMPAAAPSVATSPVALAVPEPIGAQLGWSNSTVTWATVLERLNTDLKLRPGIVDPNRDAVGVSTLVTITSVVPTLGVRGDQVAAGAVKALLAGRSEVPSALLARFPRDATPRTLSTSLSLAPLSEQALLTFNGNGPPVPLVAVYPEPSALALDYPYAVLPRLSEDRAEAAEAFRAALSGPEFRSLLATYRLRAADGTAGAGLTLGPSAPVLPNLTPIPDPAVIEQALRAATEATG
jgi:Ca-activated chloride channel homolog